MRTLQKYLYYFLFFVTPLVMFSGTSELFEFNKMITIYIVVTAILSVWCVRMIQTGKFYIRRTPFDIFIGLFFISQVISTIFSIDLHTSIFGYYSRFNGNLLSIILYILLAFIMISEIKSAEIKKLILYLIASSTVISIYAVAQKLISPFELMAALILAGLFSLTALLPEQKMFFQTGNFYSGGGLSETGVFWALIYNLAIFFELLGLLFSGYLRRETWLINLGALFLFLLIIVKYFDWFFTFFDKSIFFIGAGILLFVVGWFMEKGRKYMISNIKEQAQQISQPHDK